MKQTFAVAAAEFRSLRRTAQTWVIVAVAVGAGLAPFLYYSVAHGIRSGYGATAGSVSPRFRLERTGTYRMRLIGWRGRVRHLL